VFVICVAESHLAFNQPATVQSVFVVFPTVPLPGAFVVVAGVVAVGIQR